MSPERNIGISITSRNKNLKSGKNKVTYCREHMSNSKYHFIFLWPFEGH